MKNSSIARRVFEPDSNSTNGWPTRSGRQHLALARQRMLGRGDDEQLLLQDRNRHQVGLFDRQGQQRQVAGAGPSCAMQRSELPVTSFRSISGCCRFNSVRSGGNT